MENEINNILKGRVMRKIYLIYIRNVLWENSLLVASLLIVVVLYFSISVSAVLRNTPKDSLGSMSQYLFSSFDHTEFAIKGLLSLLALCTLTPVIKFGLRAYRKDYSLG